MAFSVHDEPQPGLPEKLLKFITQQQEQIIQLQGQIEALEAEVRRLKKLPPKPDIKPNTEPPDDGTGTEQPAAEDDSPNPDTSRKRKVNKPDEKTTNNLLP